MAEKLEFVDVESLGWTEETVKNIKLPEGQIFYSFWKPKEGDKLFVLTNKDVFRVKGD